MTKLTETVTVTREVDPRIGDLVHFARRMLLRFPNASPSDAELIRCANEYWDQQHGEDD